MTKWDQGPLKDILFKGQKWDSQLQDIKFQVQNDIEVRWLTFDFSDTIKGHLKVIWFQGQNKIMSIEGHDFNDKIRCSWNQMSHLT